MVIKHKIKVKVNNKMLSTSLTKKVNIVLRGNFCLYFILILNLQQATKHNQAKVNR